MRETQRRREACQSNNCSIYLMLLKYLWEMHSRFTNTAHFTHHSEMPQYRTYSLRKQSPHIRHKHIVCENSPLIYDTNTLSAKTVPPYTTQTHCLRKQPPPYTTQTHCLRKQSPHIRHKHIVCENSPPIYDTNTLSAKTVPPYTTQTHCRRTQRKQSPHIRHKHIVCENSPLIYDTNTLSAKTVPSYTTQTHCLRKQSPHIRHKHIVCENSPLIYDTNTLFQLICKCAYNA